MPGSHDCGRRRSPCHDAGPSTCPAVVWKHAAIYAECPESQLVLDSSDSAFQKLYRVWRYGEDPEHCALEISGSVSAFSIRADVVQIYLVKIELLKDLDTLSAADSDSDDLVVPVGIIHEARPVAIAKRNRFKAWRPQFLASTQSSRWVGFQ